MAQQMQVSVWLQRAHIDHNPLLSLNHEPYVEVVVGTQRQQTRVYEEGDDLCPWSDKLLFTVKHGDTIRLIVHARALQGFIRLGEVAVPASEVIRRGGQLKASYPFKSQLGQGVITTEILVVSSGEQRLSAISQQAEGFRNPFYDEEISEISLMPVAGSITSSQGSRPRVLSIPPGLKRGANTPLLQSGLSAFTSEYGGVQHPVAPVRQVMASPSRVTSQDIRQQTRIFEPRGSRLRMSLPLMAEEITYTSQVVETRTASVRRLLLAGVPLFPQV